MNSLNTLRYVLFKKKKKNDVQETPTSHRVFSRAIITVLFVIIFVFSYKYHSLVFGAIDNYV